MLAALIALAGFVGAGYALHEQHYAAGWVCMAAGVLMSLAAVALAGIEDDDEGMA